MNRILMASGREFPCSYFGVASAGVLFADIEADLLTAAKVFSDESETSTIGYVYENNGETNTRTITGFTSLLSVSNLYGEKQGVRIAMQRPFVMDGEA